MIYTMSNQIYRDATHKYKYAANFYLAAAQTCGNDNEETMHLTQDYNEIPGLTYNATTYTWTVSEEMVLLCNYDIRWEHFGSKTEESLTYRKTAILVDGFSFYLHANTVEGNQSPNVDHVDDVEQTYSSGGFILSTGEMLYHNIPVPFSFHMFGEQNTGGDLQVQYLTLNIVRLF